jgi:hypothetical protein
VLIVLLIVCSVYARHVSRNNRSVLPEQNNDDNCFSYNNQKKLLLVVHGIHGHQIFSGGREVKFVYPIFDGQLVFLKNKIK